MKTPFRIVFAIAVGMLLTVGTGARAHAQDDPGTEPEAPVADEAPIADEAPVDATPIDETPAEDPFDESTDEGSVEDSVEVGPAGDGPIYESGGLFGVGLVIAPKVGGGFGQLTSDLGTSFVGELELGYTLPLPEPVNRDIEIFLAGQYAGPSAADTVYVADPRLPGDGTWSYDLTLQQVNLTLGLLYRIPVPADWVRPYVAAGGRMVLSRTEVSGKSNGMPYGDNEETATDFGGYGALGADFFVGPGSILFEVQFAYAAIDGTVLQNTNAGALNLALGYRFFL